MKTVLKKTASFLSCCILAVSQVPNVSVFAEEPPKGTVTVTVYDDETGELADQNLTFQISGTTKGLQQYGMSYGYGNWNVAETNPYTNEAFEIKPGWIYSVKLGGYKDSLYHYSINEEKSQTALDFEADTDQNLSVYVSKKEKSGMLIYRGTFGEEKYPLFEYFYQPNYSNRYSEHKPVIYAGEFPAELKYGDVYLMSNRYPVLSAGYKYVKKLNPDAELQYSGNCLDGDNEDYMVKTLTYAYVSRPDVQQGKEPDPQSSVTFTLEDEKGMEYGFAAYEYLLDSEYLISGAKLGDTGDFVMLDKYPVLPVNEPNHVPDIMGDINEDRVFDLADVIVLNRWLLADPDVKISDWMAADLNKDSKLDAADLLLIKQALWDDRARPSCTLNILTSYNGYGVDGQYLGDGSFTQSFTVRAGDWFYEDSMAGWAKNTLDKHRYEGKLLTVKDITEEGVVINYIDMDSIINEPEFSDHLIPFGESCNVMSNIRIMDGYNYSHSIVFSDYDAGGAK